MNAPILQSVFGAIFGHRPNAVTEPGHPADRRAAPRVQAALACEVVAAGVHYRGHISDISRTGLTLGFESMPPLFKGSQLLVRAGAFEPITGAVRWIGAQHCGIAFNTALAQDVLDNTDALFDPGMRVRPGRARIKLPAMIRALGSERKVVIEDIGCGGLRFATGLPLMPGSGLMIDIDDILPLGAYVRWSKPGHCGVMFSKLLPIAAAETLAERCRIHRSWLNEIVVAHAMLAAVKA